MRRSIATVCLSGTLPEKLEAAAAARFDAVEIFENDLLFYESSPRNVRLQAADLGLKIALYQPFRDFESVDDAQFQRNLERAERKFDVMQELGAPMMLVCSNVSPQAIDDPARAAAQLYALAERAGQRGLRIGYEALAWGTRVRTYGQAWSVVKQADHPHLGLVLDSFHTLALGDDMTGIASLPDDKIFFVQLADAPKLSLDVLSWSRHYRNFPGQGDLDVTGFLTQAVRAGYAGPISLEVFSDEFRASPTRPTASDGMRSLLYLEEQVRRRLDEEAPAAPRKPRRVELFDPPPPPVIEGTAFIEFAVDDSSEATLSRFLTQLGFRRAAHHRSKKVTLFRQGGINFILNAEPNSFAHAYFLMHGPSICAIGLKTDDDLQALSRAEALGCARFDGRVGPHERTVPAIRALDGSLLYFVKETDSGDGPLAVDFVTDSDAAGARELGLIAVDHIAEALPAGQLDSWILFYRSILDIVPDSSVMLTDPYGVVRSRAIASANRTVRFPLNTSAYRETTTARSVTTFAGAGVNHIALSSNDIFATAAALEANGVPLLAIPTNYYDDLAARYALDGEMLERLKRHNVLYERAGSGEYFQLYTDLFEERFFVEIVQRVGGYDLYGAANAPVRMAAQAQRRQRAAKSVAELL
jgi:4-hydroxyphenylpyruvate dioxygenase